MKRFGDWLFGQPYILLTLTTLFWAGNALVARAMAAELPPVGLAFWRWTLAFLILLPICGRQMVEDWPIVRRNWPVVVLLSILGVSCFNTMLYLGLQDIAALNAALQQSTMPIWVAVISLILFRERLGIWQALGILVSLFGVLIVLLQGRLEDLLTLTIGRGDLWALAAVICYAGYSVLLRLKPSGFRPLSFVGLTFLIGNLFLLPFYLWETFALNHPMPVTFPAAASVIYVALLPSILAYLFWNRGMEILGANRGGIFIHLVPAFVAVGSVTLLDENPQLYHLAGVAFILIGIRLSARKSPDDQGAA